MKPAAIGIVGPDTLLAKELGEILERGPFPALPPRLIAPPASAPQENDGARRLTAFGDEAALTDAFSAAALADLDLVFLACSEAEAALAAPLLRAAACRVVDLNAQPHPAAQALAHLLDRLELVGPLTAAANVFEPASQHGWAGIQELEQQTKRILSLQSLPTEVFGGQLAFNLRPAPPPVRQRILADLRALRATHDLPALQVLQAPIFHASVISLHVRYQNATAPEAVVAGLDSPWLRRISGDEPPPDVLSAAGEDAIQLAGPLSDSSDPAGGYWLFATLDNLRRSALSAVDAAAALLARPA